MAALGKIRKHSALLIGAIGLGLFGFIAGDGLKNCQSIDQFNRNIAGTVLGEKVDPQEFSKMVDEYTEAMKLQYQTNDFNSDQLTSFRDQVWQEICQQKIIENECEKLGITVTDEEMQRVLTEGTNPMLANTPFVNQQTGKFDYNLVKEFLTNYKQNPQLQEQLKSAYYFWKRTEKNLRIGLLASKYQSLMAGCMLSNEISEKAQFDAENVENNIKLASFAYSSINDKDVKVEEADLKAKYDEIKPLFRQPVETRDIQYVDVKVIPSATDLNALNKEFAGYKAQLEGEGSVGDIVRKSGSIVSYNGIAKKKEAYGSDIAALIDSTAVGATSAIKDNVAENTKYVAKVIAKETLADSIEFRAIQVPAMKEGDDVAKRADSIQTALQGGAEFEVIAKKYGQTGEKQWLTSDQYQNSAADPDTKTYLEALLKGDANAVQNLKLANGANLVLQVTQKKAMKEMYDVAVIKKPIQFSKETSQSAFNKFSEFVAKSKTLDELKSNAKKYGYEVKEQNGIATSVHDVAYVRSTTEALRWIFDASTKVGEVSKLYECGDNGDHYMVVVLTGINEEGYADLSNKAVKEEVQRRVIADKKAAKLMEKASKCKTVADAEKAGAKVSDVNQITMAAAAFVPETGAQEPALSGAVASTAQGKFSKAPVKGNAGVYVFQVVEKKNLGGKMDKKAMAEKVKSQSMSMIGQLPELFENAKIKDNRYLFF